MYKRRIEGPTEIVRVLDSGGLSEQSLLFEWLNGYCDRRHLQRLLVLVGHGNLHPPIKNSVRPSRGG
jgi:hypothetical protein